ncbi:MAG: hypothetical protein DMF00_13370 [Verrucomicrobia bacterium]|nr:MAG: hypothetical protein DMF00_13370 [Verrucomicrobiota bacterium]
MPRIFWKCHTERLDLINGSVSRIKLSRQIVETNIAASLPDFPFLSRSHVVILSEAKNRRCLKHQRCFASLNMTASVKLLELP